MDHWEPDSYPLQVCLSYRYCLFDSVHPIDLSKFLSQLFCLKGRSSVGRGGEQPKRDQLGSARQPENQPGKQPENQPGKQPGKQIGKQYGTIPGQQHPRGVYSHGAFQLFNPGLCE